jgi:Recombination endonuclease VII
LDLREKLMSSLPAPGICTYCGVNPKAKPKHKCEECLEYALPMDAQKTLARARLTQWDGTKPSAVARAAKLRDGYRWCTGCGSWRRIDSDGRKYAVSPSSTRCRPCVSGAAQVQTFDITTDQLNELRKLSKDTCQICGVHQLNSISLAVDHDHSSGVVRGLLDGKGGYSCNEVLGYWHEDIHRFVSTAIYLINSPARQVGKGDPPLSKRETLVALIEAAKEVLDALPYRELH